MKIKVPAISAAATLILTACAGGGASEPKVPRCHTYGAAYRQCQAE